MSTTAEEKKWTYVDVPGAMCSIIDPEGREIGYGDIHEDDAKRLTDMLNELEKLREAGEISDEEILNKYPQRDESGKFLRKNLYRRGGARWMRSKLSPKIAAMKEKYSLLFEENAGQYLDLHLAKNQIAQLQAEKERMETDIVGLLQQLNSVLQSARELQFKNGVATPESVAALFSQCLKTEEWKKDNDVIRKYYALASLPEEGKTND